MLTDTDIQSLAEKLAAKEPRLRIAFNEANDNRGAEPEAQHFLKLDEKRLGRDFRLYGFMADKVEGPSATIVRLFEEVVLPLQKTSPEAYAEGWTWLKDQGPTFKNNQDAWEELLNGDDFRPKI